MPDERMRGFLNRQSDTHVRDTDPASRISRRGLAIAIAIAVVTLGALIFLLAG